MREAGQRLTTLMRTSGVQARESPALILQVSKKRCDHGPSCRAAIVAGEQCVFPCQGQTADRTLDGGVVDLDAAVFEEAAQAVPMVEAIGERFGELAALRHPGETVLEPGLQGFDDGF